MKKIVILLVILAFLILVGFVFPNSIRKSEFSRTVDITPTLSITNQSLKTFRSQNLNFSLELPVLSEVKDGTTSVIVNYKEGQIIVVRNGTEFSNLMNYLEEFDRSNNWKIVEEKNITIKGYPTVVRLFKRTQDSTTKERMFFLYVNGSIYKMSTVSENLFSDLDQIAQSFKYTP